MIPNFKIQWFTIWSKFSIFPILGSELLLPSIIWVLFEMLKKTSSLRKIVSAIIFWKFCMQWALFCTTSFSFFSPLIWKTNKKYWLHKKCNKHSFELWCKWIVIVSYWPTFLPFYDKRVYPTQAVRVNGLLRYNKNGKFYHRRRLDMHIIQCGRGISLKFVEIILY